MHRVTKATSVFGLSRMNKILEHCGNPQQKLRAVHIAGTKGKGSTAAMLASILRRTGRRIGLYTSPHLVDIRERIQIDGEWIPEADVTRLLNRLHPYLEVAKLGGETYAPTFFEIFTTLAFLYFLEQAADVSIFEVGLGGRLDATNVLSPLACGITPVSFDHMDKLGTELWQIAGEKAGIVKPGVPVVSGPQRPEALDVIRAKCAELGSPLKVVGEDIRVTAGDGSAFGIRTWRRELRGLTLPLLGLHQRANAAAAVGLAELLGESGFAVADECVRAGLASIEWPGRIQVVSDRPEIIVDGAHNVASVAVLVEALAARPPKRTIYVVGIARDKDVPAMLKLLGPRGDEFIVTKTNNPRAADPAELQSLLHQLDPEKAVLAAANPEDALALARRRAAPADRICVTGSMYLAGDALRVLRRA